MAVLLEVPRKVLKPYSSSIPSCYDVSLVQEDNYNTAELLLFDWLKLAGVLLLKATAFESDGKFTGPISSVFRVYRYVNLRCPYEYVCTIALLPFLTKDEIIISTPD